MIATVFDFDIWAPLSYIWSQVTEGMKQFSLWMWGKLFYFLVLTLNFLDLNALATALQSAMTGTSSITPYLVAANNWLPISEASALWSAYSTFYVLLISARLLRRILPFGG